MHSEKKQGAQSTIVLSITLDAAEVQTHEKAALKKLSSEVKIDGFRNGHVPEKIIREKVGAIAIQQECIDLAINKAYAEALRAENIIPLDRPKVDITTLEPLVFTCTIPVYPEVTVKRDGLDAFKVAAVVVSEEEIDETLKMFQNNLSEKKEIDAPVKKGHVVEISFHGKNAEGVSQDGMQSNMHPLEVGSNTFIPGFEDQLIGMQKGEEKTFPITFPADYHASDYAGKEFFFTVVILSVQEKVLPAIDDAFVKRLTGKDETVADLRKEIATHLAERKNNEEYAKKQQELFDAIGANTTAEIPAIMQDEEIETIIDNIKMQGLQMGMPWEKYLKMTQKTEEQLKEEVKEQAIKTVKSRLGLRKILEEDPIAISNEEIQEEIHKELARVPANKRKEQEHYFSKGNQGWFQIENRLQIRSFFKKMLSA